MAMENEVVRAYQELELRYQQALSELETLRRNGLPPSEHPRVTLLGVVRCPKCSQLMEVMK